MSVSAAIGDRPEDVLDEAARRRTFAIISHPDAGKTTLTEKFLLYSGAIGEAGAVKARRNRRAATSDWMSMERERGISITSAVLQFPYRDTSCNLLDTPGHRDFSEDTYRVLSAADAAVMVLDVAKGVEPQTLKLFEVARARGIPVLTFLNKYDRPGREPLELLDEIEKTIGLVPAPVTWPVGIPGQFKGVIDRRSGDFVRYERMAHGSLAAPEEVVDSDRASREEGADWLRAKEEIALLEEAGYTLDQGAFDEGMMTPVFVGSALTNFGVRLLLDAVVDLAPAPQPRATSTGSRRPLTAPFSGQVFKVQANMDPAHRDRVAFLRVASGRFERGMTVTHARSGRRITTKYAATVFGAERETVDEAFPGDVVALVNAAGLRVGDSVYSDEPVEFPPIPSFAPEVFAVARPVDLSKRKQFDRGLEQLDEEGVVQVLRDPRAVEPFPLVAAVGTLQFDVFSRRMAEVFGAEVVMSSAPYALARRTDQKSVPLLAAKRTGRVTQRRDGALLALFESEFGVKLLERDAPEITLLPVVESEVDR